MKTKKISLGSATVGIVLCAASLAPAVAQDEPKRPWTDIAEFSLLNTTGNTKNTNFGLANKYAYAWQKADFAFDVVAIRNETDNVKTAEAYIANGKYRRNITDRLLWYGLAGWGRNEFAGFDDRYNAGVGVGYRFLKTAEHSLVGELGADYTDETWTDPVDETRTGGSSDNWAGARGFLGYELALSENSKFNSELEVLENLDETSDYRINFLASITATLTKKLALKAGYRVLFDNEPVQIFDEAGQVVKTYEDTDTYFTTSLVINF